MNARHSGIVGKHIVWTEARVALALVMWTDGKTAQQIADVINEMPGPTVSAHAVIGMAWRRKFPRHAHAADLTKAREAQAQYVAVRRAIPRSAPVKKSRKKSRVHKRFARKAGEIAPRPPAPVQPLLTAPVLPHDLYQVTMPPPIEPVRAKILGLLVRRAGHLLLRERAAELARLAALRRPKPPPKPKLVQTPAAKPPPSKWIPRSECLYRCMCGRGFETMGELWPHQDACATHQRLTAPVSGRMGDESSAGTGPDAKRQGGRM